jgi:nucleotide-binding universal stress UspA family protein
MTDAVSVGGIGGGPIAVAVDGSPASQGALEQALRLAHQLERPLAGVFVLDTGWADYIGNDWQSAAGARQGFLDYVRVHLEAQAEEARRQFAAATTELADASFSILAGDPLEALCAMMAKGQVDMLVAGRRVFQVCGRPSVKRLAKELPRRIQQSVMIV